MLEKTECEPTATSSLQGSDREDNEIRHQHSEAAALEAAFEEIELLNRLYGGRIVGFVQHVPPHHFMVLMWRRTNKLAGYLSHSGFVPAGPTLRIEKLVPKRRFETTCRLEFDTADLQVARLTCALSYSYKDPVKLVQSIFHGIGFKAAHEIVCQALLSHYVSKALKDFVQQRTFKGLIADADQISEYVLDYPHTAESGRIQVSARQSMLREYGVGGVEFSVTHIQPTATMRQAHEAANTKRLEIDCEIESQERTAQVGVNELAHFLEALRPRLLQLSDEEFGRFLLDWYAINTMGPNSQIHGAYVSAAASDAVKSTVQMLKPAIESIGEDAGARNIVGTVIGAEMLRRGLRFSPQATSSLSIGNGLPRSPMYGPPISSVETRARLSRAPVRLNATAKRKRPLGFRKR